MEQKTNPDDLVGRIIEIDREKIRPFEIQPRRFFDEDPDQEGLEGGLNDLAKSIRAIGQVVPITVRPLVDDPKHDFELVDGERRWRAFGLIPQEKRKKMSAIVVNPDTEVAQYTMSITANFGRKGHTVVETIWFVQYLSGHNKTAKEIAECCSRTLPWAYQYIKLASLPEDVINLLRLEEERGKKPLPIQAAVLLSDIPDKDEQRRLACEIVKRKMSGGEASFFVTGQARLAGHKVGSKERSPNQDHKKLVGFIGRLGVDSTVWRNLPEELFDPMFESRRWQEMKDMRQGIEEAIANLRAICERLETIEEMK